MTIESAWWLGMIDPINSLIVALVTGFVTGVSTGLVSTRMARFEELRSEARRIIWAIDYFYDAGEAPRIVERRPTGDLLFVSGELYALKHKRAGNTVSRLLKEVRQCLGR